MGHLQKYLINKSPMKSIESSIIQSKLNGILAQVQTPFVSEDLQFELTARNAKWMKTGDSAGDCTACGSINYWTLGSWIGSFENLEMTVYDKGKFFARIIMLAGTFEGKPAFYVHAIEFNPQLRELRGQSNEKEITKAQIKNLTTAFDFLAKHAAKAGVQDMIVTRISNSSDYSKVLKVSVGE